ncbi:cold shock domain-containing protein [Lacticaseibacillus thailandensis]|uniref:CSD domain-containing protein n=1 Tax=Lacticaseibacillus thailandensis DSM 22698 = JCM 13996 TaxID=1423810 RepID=A0A0R2CEB8_9LACO|nr:cold shock domain-containing protein [Lacticaseibacillus thailandensis]KRM86715.1 hypothetical protein FD19_GL001765 [Lacticaseibacillus thailandensis DSM 22698 = JCM 13996]
MQLGKVRWYDAGVGRGIIDADDGKVVFLPYHAIEGTDISRFQLTEKQRVEFDLTNEAFSFDGLTGQYRATRMRPVK